MNPLQEKIIIIRLKKGDREAYGRIYDYYVERIYRFVFFKVATQEIAQDITSDCFLKVFEYILATANEIRSIQALLYRTARNLVIDYYRARGQATVSLAEGVLVKSEGYGSEKQVVDNLEKQRILQIIKKLSNEDWQEIILLKFVEGHSTREIARIMDKKVGAIRTALSRALKELKKNLPK